MLLNIKDTLKYLNVDPLTTISEFIMPHQMYLWIIFLPEKSINAWSRS